MLRIRIQALQLHTAFFLFSQTEKKTKKKQTRGDSRGKRCNDAWGDEICHYGESFENSSDVEIANAVNAAFLEPMEPYEPLHAISTNENDSAALSITEPAVLSALTKLNARKAAGPDGIGNWLLRKYAEILVQPITFILNASFREQRLPTSWKLADLVPLPKQKPVEDLIKHLRPISLTPAISKLAEDFVVSTHVGPVVLQTIDSNRCGGIPRSSTLYALISMIRVHHRSKATDGTGAAVRVVLFDYRKAFDLINDNLLATKILGLDIHNASLVGYWTS